MTFTVYYWSSVDFIYCVNIDIFMFDYIQMTFSNLNDLCMYRTLFLQGTDQSLVEKLNTHFAGNDYYGKSTQSKSSKFTINHYAGKVSSSCMV